VQHVRDARGAVHQVRTRGAHPHLVHGRSVTNKLGALDAIAAALSFPAYFGRNLDALLDCLNDLSWLPAGEHVLIWTHPDVLRTADPRGYADISSVLDESETRGRRTDRTLRVVLADA